ncbi:hypothetical protein [Actinomadura rupiterrae]|uniref:hypothetical protein n=1 Tax=Actinomadura rupiterrae TaxID=559627 RepID=UPI0020A32107|nr:hypothetical protein [Actinomadura rupiterrae]MCP2338105.1 hypothetical protein [Actinomadura rupiterrae]
MRGGRWRIGGGEGAAGREQALELARRSRSACRRWPSSRCWCSPATAWTRTLGRVRLTGREDVLSMLLAAPKRLNAPMVKAVAAYLEEGFPAYEANALPERPAAAAGEKSGLFDVEEVEQAAMASVLHGRSSSG